MRATPNVDGGLLAAGLLVGVAGAIFLGLAWAAAPADFDHRTRAVESELSWAEAWAAKAPRQARFAPQAICSDAGNAAAAALRARLETAASTAGVALTAVSTAPAEGQLGSGIAPIVVQFETTGHYDGVLSMLSTLARQNPEIFTDSADLTSQVSNVDFKFLGRIYCSAHN